MSWSHTRYPIPSIGLYAFQKTQRSTVLIVFTVCPHLRAGKPKYLLCTSDNIADPLVDQSLRKFAKNTPYDTVFLLKQTFTASGRQNIDIFGENVRNLPENLIAGEERRKKWHTARPVVTSILRKPRDPLEHPWTQRRSAVCVFLRKWSVIVNYLTSSWNWINLWININMAKWT